MPRLGTVIGMCASAGALTALVVGVGSAGSDAAPRPSSFLPVAAAAPPASHVAVTKKGKSPIKHVVVIFDENISYDHYFGTYPKATNKGGTRFRAKKDTPKNDNLVTSKKLKKTPNLYKPFRLGPD